MKRVISLLCIFILMLSIMVGCGAAKDAEKSMASSPKQEAANESANYDMAAADTATTSKVGSNGESENKASAEKPAASGEVTAVTGTGSSSSTVSNAILAQRKIIRNANMSVEVEDFDKAYGQIKSMISAFGFIQESSIKKEKIYVNSQEKLLTKGVIIIRVAKDKFESVLTDVKGLGLLLDENIRSNDVTDQYFDTESSLRLLKYEQSRLEQYLFKLEDPDIIFKTESRLTEIRHEIEKLTGTLNKWDDLVELSTITINLSERRPDAAQIQQKEASYWNQLSGSFVSSIKGVTRFCGNLLIFLAQAIPVLILLALLTLLALWVYKKFFKTATDVSKKDTDV